MADVVEQERAQFDEMMLRACAKLTDFARPYVGKLVPRERDEFWQRAMHEAWLRRAKFHPESHSILEWWDGCLKATALARETWTVIALDGGRETVKGKHLGGKR